MIPPTNARNSRFEMVPLKNSLVWIVTVFFFHPKEEGWEELKIPSGWVVEFLKLQCHIILADLVPRNRCYPTATAKWLDLIVRNRWLEHAPGDFIDMYIYIDRMWSDNGKCQWEFQEPPRTWDPRYCKLPIRASHIFSQLLWEWYGKSVGDG